MHPTLSQFGEHYAEASRAHRGTASALSYCHAEPFASDLMKIITFLGSSLHNDFEVNSHRED
jgi:hypothetical protein